jgi:predicted outer membrane protein
MKLRKPSLEAKDHSSPMRPLAAIAILALLALTPAAHAADPARIALVSLCDPAKIATLTSDRAANPWVRKITYWLEVARQSGRDPQAEMEAVTVTDQLLLSEKARIAFANYLGS